MSELLFEILDGGVARITLNRPEARNAISRAMRIGIADMLAKADADNSIGAIILTGAGAQAFSASLDIKELSENAETVREVTSRNPAFNTEVAVDQCVKPLIGAINGLCINAALEIALACDMLIASENACFADTHARGMGVLAGWGLTQRLQRVIGPGRAREMSLSCNYIDARTAEAWGLVNRVVPFERLAEEALTLARAIAANNQATVLAAKAVMKQGFALSLGEALDHERAVAKRFNGRVTQQEIADRSNALLGR